MQNDKPLSFYEELFAQIKEKITDELNIQEPLSDEEIKNNLLYIIKQYEIEFKDDFTELFLFNYYQNLINTNTMNKIITFAKYKKGFDDKGKEEILKAERSNCYDILYLYGLKKDPNSPNDNQYISSFTGNTITLKQDAIDIINNNDIFFVKPRGIPFLRGPHTTYTLEYSAHYWKHFKENITNYIEKFKKTHSEDYLEDIKDYRYWLNQYRVFNAFSSYINVGQTFKGGEKHVKN